MDDCLVCVLVEYKLYGKLQLYIVILFEFIHGNEIIINQHLFYLLQCHWE